MDEIYPKKMQTGFWFIAAGIVVLVLYLQDWKSNLII